MPRTHQYRTTVTWTGNRGTGTSGYKAYGRDHDISAPGVPGLAGSSDRAFHGDRDRWNPELLFTAALSQCHLLSYLHVCADAGVVVTGYTDEARKSGIEGKLKLKITIGADGAVSHVDVLTSVDPGLDAAAVAIANKWRFRPAQRSGKAIAGGTYVLVRVFELAD